MAYSALLVLLAVAMVFSLATAFYVPEEDLDFEALAEEMAKRDDDGYDDGLTDMEKRSYPRCRHWFTKSLCRCDYSFGKYEEERYHCLTRQRGFDRRGPFS